MCIHSYHCGIYLVYQSSQYPILQQKPVNPIIKNGAQNWSPDHQIHSHPKGRVNLVGLAFLTCFPHVFQNLIVLDPLAVNEEKIRPSLEKRLEAIISGAALLADSSCTRDFHRERIIAECNAIRQALQDLLSEYINNVGNQTSFHF